MRNDRGQERTISSVENALVLLEAFGERPSVSVKEGAGLLGVAPSTAHRLLTTLQAHGFVTQDPATRRYRAGSVLLDIALGALRGIDVRRIAHPFLERLTEVVRETVNLIVLDGSQIRFIDSIEGPEAVRVSSRTGAVLPAHCTAGGKLLLARLSPASLLRLYPTRRLNGLTPRSIVDQGRLFAELEEVREKGYATSFEQSTLGLSAVAVGIFDPKAEIIAAIGVSAPSARLDEDRVASIVGAASKTAALIEASMREPLTPG
ncbi:MAG: IclR family transcriptional regulator [Acidimicrobiales bacterium]